MEPYSGNDRTNDANKFKREAKEALKAVKKAVKTVKAADKAAAVAAKASNDDDIEKNNKQLTLAREKNADDTLSTATADVQLVNGLAEGLKLL